MRAERWTTVLYTLIAVATARLMWLAGAYVLDARGVERRHVETGGFLFAGVLLIAAATHPAREGSDVECAPSSIPPLLLWTVYVLSAVALYWPSLCIGFLSDDFVLFDAAMRKDATPAGWMFFRPLPLAVWIVVASVADGARAATALHVISVALHATNAWLVTIVARRMDYRPLAALSAGIVFLVFPTSVEAVAWASAIFDVALATCALSAVASALNPEVTGRRAVLTVFVITIAAIGIKETAVALPAIVAAFVYMRYGRKGLSAFAPAIAALLCVVLYVALRLWNGVDTGGFPPLSRYTAKELLVRPYGALALPFHESVMQQHRTLVAMVATLTPLLIVLSAMFGWRERREALRVAMALAAVVLISVLPVFTAMFVGPDLQGARYLYVGSAAWALLLGGLVNGRSPLAVAPRVGLAAVVALAGVYAFAVRWHQHPWQQAAALRDSVLGTVVRQVEGCRTVSVGGVPDQVDGAFVLRNGLREALAARGIRLEHDRADCHVDFKSGTQSFIRPPAR